MADDRKIVIGVEIDTTAAEGSLQELEDTVESLRKELNKQEIGSDRFQELAREIQKVESEIKDVELAFESLDSEQRLTAASDAVVGLAGGFAAAEGAAALFGAESQELEETLRRVSGALALSQGLRDLANGAIALKKLGGAAEIAKKAQIALNNAWKASPIGIVAAALAGLTLSLVAYAEKSRIAAQATDLNFQRQKALTDARNKAKESLVSQKLELDSLVEVARDESLSLEDREEAIKQLNELSPQYLGDLNTQNILTEEGTKMINKYAEALQKRAMVQALEESLVELSKERLKIAREEVSTSQDFADVQFAVVGSMWDLISGKQTDASMTDILNKKDKIAIDRKNEQIAAIKAQEKAYATLLTEYKKEEVALDKSSRDYEHQTHTIKDNTEARVNLDNIITESIDTSDQLEKATTLVQDSIISGLHEEIEARKVVAEIAGQTEFQKRLEMERTAEQARKDRAEQAAEEDAVRQSQIDKAQQGLDAINSVNELFQSKELARIKAKKDAGEELDASERNMLGRANKRRKDLAVAQIAIDTARGVSAAVAAGAGLVFPANIPAILSGVSAVLAGAVQARRILGDSGGGVDSTAAISAASAGAAGAAINPISNTASLVNQSQQEIVSRVVVVESDITAAQDSVASVAESASF